MRIGILAIAILALPLVAACQKLIEPLEGPPAFEATVDSVQVDVLDTFILWVSGLRAIENPIAAYPAATTVYVRPAAKVFQDDGRELKESSRSDIRAGQTIRVWIMSVELLSDPPQYGARQVTIQVGP